MSDRLDIDALLIGSLYGELDSTEAARLQAHLESHPADRTALADLTRARTVVRESRIFEVQADPPQSISALLIQEAARRAPKRVEEKESWFQRFLASLRHPAMAAAAMLVVVVGVAGTMYMRNGDQYAEQTKSATPSLPPAPAETSAVAQSAAGSAAAFGSGMAAPAPVTGADQQAQEAAKLSNGAADDFRVRLEDAPADLKKQDSADGAVRGKAEAKQGKLGGSSSIEVSTPNRRPMPKDLDDAAPAKEKRNYAEPPATTPRNAPGMADTTKGRGATAPNADPKPTTTVSPSAPPPAAGAGGNATARDRAADKSTATRAPQQEQQKPAETKDAKDSAEISWAKAQHKQVVDRAKSGNCREAANLAVQLSNRAPSYYQQYVENDRDLKQCFTTINRERELDQEKKARAKQRSEEPSPRPADVTK